MIRELHHKQFRGTTDRRHPLSGATAKQDSLFEHGDALFERFHGQGQYYFFLVLEVLIDSAFGDTHIGGDPVHVQAQVAHLTKKIPGNRQNLFLAIEYFPLFSSDGNHTDIFDETSEKASANLSHLPSLVKMMWFAAVAAMGNVKESSAQGIPAMAIG